MVSNRRKSQSAIEYVMTYGWAVLIIAVVVGSFYQLGFFSSQPQNLAKPGSCQVLRPNGPASTQFLSLQGLCNNALPQTVVSFTGSTGNVVVLNPANVLNVGNSLTISYWINPYGQQSAYPGVFSQSSGPGQRDIIIYLAIGAGGTYTSFSTTFSYIDSNGVIHDGITTSKAINAGKFSQMAVTFNGGGGNGQGVVTWYINGTQEGQTTGLNSIEATSNDIWFGTAYGKYLNGMMSNVQVYDTALNPNSINHLYIEGIGGTPVNLFSLVGWWPLNGNPNDYSGNMDNGQVSATATNVLWPNNWYITTGYSTP